MRRLAVLVLALATGCAAPRAPVRALMLVGGSHHEYDTLPRLLADRLAAGGDLAIDVTKDPARVNAAELARHDVLVIHTCLPETPFDEAQRRAVLDHLAAGRGLVSIHCGLASFRDWPEWARIVGGFAPGHEPYGTFTAKVVLEHPAVLGLPARFDITDEAYFVDRREPGVDVLVRTARPLVGPDGAAREGDEPQVWSRAWGEGRVFVTTFGHDGAAQSNTEFLTSIRQGILWSARRL